jgi:hypothetical protein
MDASLRFENSAEYDCYIGNDVVLVLNFKYE